MPSPRGRLGYALAAPKRTGIASASTAALAPAACLAPTRNRRELMRDWVIPLHEALALPLRPPEQIDPGPYSDICFVWRNSSLPTAWQSLVGGCCMRSSASCFGGGSGERGDTSAGRRASAGPGSVSAWRRPPSGHLRLQMAAVTSGVQAGLAHSQTRIAKCSKTRVWVRLHRSILDELGRP